MYYFKRVDPHQFTARDALEYGEVFVRAFDRDPLIAFVAGQTYPLHQPHQIQAIRDPRERLQTYLQRAETYDTMCKIWGCSIWRKLLRNDVDMHGVYDDQCRDEATGHDRLVSLAVWQYPDYMADDLAREVGKVGWKWWVYSQLQSFKLWVQELWLRKIVLPHPFYNSRLDSMNELKFAVHDKDRLTYNQVASLPTEHDVTAASYPKSSMVYLMFLGVNPEYQRQGIGRLIIENSLKTIPDTRPKFVMNDKVLSGPQKFYLEATDAGMGLYSKFGFEVKARYSHGSKFNATLMCMSR